MSSDTYYPSEDMVKRRINLKLKRTVAQKLAKESEDQCRSLNEMVKFIIEKYFTEGEIGKGK